MQNSRRLKSAVLWIFFAANLAVISWFWWSGSHTYITGDIPKQLIAAGRISGLLLVYFVLLQLLLIGRTGWIEKLFGLDKLSRLHHWIGFALLSFLLAHPLLLTIGYSYRNGKSILQQYFDFFGWEDVFKAAIAFWLFVFVIAASLVIVARKMKYETWYFIHLATYLAILLAFGHQLNVGRDLMDTTFAGYWYALYAFVILNFVYYRFFRPLYNQFRFGFTVDRIVEETPDVISIYLKGQSLEKFSYKAGQFLIVRFLAKGYWWQAHPFSISSSPGDGNLRLTIKNSGDFTASLWQLKPGSKVLVDGPHGIFTADRAEHDKFLFIAGGIGVTPILSLIGTLAPTGKDCTLIYASRDMASTALKGEIDALAAKHKCRVHYVISNDPNWDGEKGFVDKDLLIRLVPDIRERDTFLCGPPMMMAVVRKALETCGVPRSCIHFEKFSL
ncbi:MAG: ferredoxin reductase family protein [Patescibacteria group bacterium]